MLHKRSNGGGIMPWPSFLKRGQQQPRGAKGRAARMGVVLPPPPGSDGGGTPVTVQRASAPLHERETVVMDRRPVRRQDRPAPYAAPAARRSVAAPRSARAQRQYGTPRTIRMPYMGRLNPSGWSIANFGTIICAAWLAVIGAHAWMAYQHWPLNTTAAWQAMYTTGKERFTPSSLLLLELAIPFLVWSLVALSNTGRFHSRQYGYISISDIIAVLAPAVVIVAALHGFILNWIDQTVGWTGGDFPLSLVVMALGSILCIVAAVLAQFGNRGLPGSAMSAMRRGGDAVLWLYIGGVGITGTVLHFFMIKWDIILG